MLFILQKFAASKLLVVSAASPLCLDQRSRSEVLADPIDWASLVNHGSESMEKTWPTWPGLAAWPPHNGKNFVAERI